MPEIVIDPTIGPVSEEDAEAWAEMSRDIAGASPDEVAMMREALNKNGLVVPECVRDELAQHGITPEMVLGALLGKLKMSN